MHAGTGSISKERIFHQINWAYMGRMTVLILVLTEPFLRDGLEAYGWSDQGLVESDVSYNYRRDGSRFEFTYPTKLFQVAPQVLFDCRKAQYEPHIWPEIDLDSCRDATA